MQKADLTTRAIAGFVDLLVVIALARLPDVLGFLSATGYILIRDGLFQGRSLGKKLIGMQVASGGAANYRDSIIRNVPLAAAYILFIIPYAGWLLGPAALIVEGLVALGDDRGMRIGDMLAMTWVVQPEQETLKTGQEPPPPDPPAQTGEKQDPFPEERSNAF
ncbi:MAG: hypothetical protein A2010_06965 [Nitrospirae bacterium GWD2_57_9]|nr:MAG: hypothetical protein A2010_06965 [Nitrospirae bacterium GWD2_57_9]